MLKIYIDDLRTKPKPFDLLFRTNEDFLEWFDNNPDETIQLLSLDHDFEYNHTDRPTPLLSGSQMVDKLITKNGNIRSIQIHSSNPHGAKYMYKTLKQSLNNGNPLNIRTMNPRLVGYTDDDKFYQVNWVDLRND